MITRRTLFRLAVATAAVATGIAVAGPPCCVFDGDLHALDCPVALAEECGDYGAEPGKHCHFGCMTYWR